MIIRILFMAAAIGCVLLLFNRALDAANSALIAGYASASGSTTVPLP